MAEKAGVHAKTQESKQKCSNSCKQNTGYNSSGSPANRILQLQRTAGNQAVQRLIKSRALQAKLRVGQPNDIYEQEADRVAEQVIRMPDPILHRKCAKCDKDEKKFLQAKESPGQRPVTQSQDLPSNFHEVLNSPGQQLDLPTRVFMEQRFNNDFSRVRVHSDAAAEQSSREVNAKAYAVGQNIVFGTGQFLPGTNEGRRLIAHELTHVVQQSGADKIYVGQSDGNRILPPVSPTFIQQGFGLSASVIQRQLESEGGQASPQEMQETDPFAFGKHNKEPNCPPVPTQLGARTPVPKCPVGDVLMEPPAGEKFHFCEDADVFRKGDDAGRVATFARNQLSGTEFIVHGFSSIEGKDDYNLNLACHRINRVVRELMNAGVRSEAIFIINYGPTEIFGSGVENRSKNRAVVVEPSPPSRKKKARKTDPNKSPNRAIVDRAIDIITSRNYFLGADAYISHWTCGAVPTVADAIERTVVRIEGEDPGLGATNEVNEIKDPKGKGGLPSFLGINEIVLSKATFDTTDPVNCAAARIIDLSFHHMARNTVGGGNLQGPGVHDGAIFLVELSGFDPCIDRNSIWWSKPTDDPLATRKPKGPGCRDEHLPGSLLTDPTAPLSKPAPSFHVLEISVQGGQGAIEWRVDVNKASIEPKAKAAFKAKAKVLATGGDTQNYEVGFIQTISAVEDTVTYVSGHTIHNLLPTPIRDGRPDASGGRSPWYEPGYSDIAGGKGVETPNPKTKLAQPAVFDTPRPQFPFEYENIEKAGRRRKNPKTGQLEIIGTRERGNVVDKVRQRLVFHQWLIARHKAAPLTPFATIFLNGTTFNFSQEADVRGVEDPASGEFRPEGIGTFRANFSSTPSEISQMQLGGPTPGDINPVLKVTFSRPPTKDEAGGMELSIFKEQIRAIVKPHMKTLGINHSIEIAIKFNQDTGRVLLDTPADRAISVRPNAPAVSLAPNVATQLIDRAIIDIRKLILGPLRPDQSKEDILKFNVEKP